MKNDHFIPILMKLYLTIPLQQRHADVGRLHDVFGHHRSACAVSGVLGGRSAALESAAARVCREAGARVSTNIFVRDLDIAMVNTTDSRRLEVVADGLPFFGGAQLAIDTTLVSALRDVTRHPETELPQLMHADARNARTLNSPEMQEGQTHRPCGGGGWAVVG